MKTVRLLGVVSCSGLGSLIALTTLMVRLRTSIRHEAWALVGFTSLAILGVMAVTAALVAGSINGWIRSRTDAADARPASTTAQRLVDGWLAPAMVGVVVVGILLTMSGVDWMIGYLPIAVFAAWLLTFSLLVQRERRGPCGAGGCGSRHSASASWACRRCTLACPAPAAQRQQILAGAGSRRRGLERHDPEQGRW